MALSVRKDTIVSPGSTGNQATSGLGFTPKVLFLWSAYQTNDANTHGNAFFSYGVGTRDGGATQQWNQKYAQTDAAATTDVIPELLTTGILSGYVLPGFTVDFLVTLTSFDADGFTLNWTDLPATASIIVHYMALGGSSIASARAGSFTTSTAAATQDVTINTGFGKPDLLSFTAGGIGGGSGIGWAKSSTERRYVSQKENWGAATSTPVAIQHDRAFITYNTPASTPGLIDSQADLSVVGSWPTDGFQVAYSDQASYGDLVGYVGLKGDFTATIGDTTVPISGSPPVDQNLTLASGVPQAAFLCGLSIPTDGTLDSTHADLLGFALGGTDGAREGVAGWTTDDAAADSNVGRFSTTTKAFRHCVAPAVATNPPSTLSEADASIVGSDLRLSWSTVDSVARSFSYVILGAVPVVWPPNQDPGPALHTIQSNQRI